jgi:hypothetical protein
VPDVSRKQLRSALALQRAVFADKLYPRFRDLLKGTLARQLRDYTQSSKPEIGVELRKQWAREIASALKRPIFAMVAHGWSLATEEFQGNSFAGKAVVGGVNIGEAPQDFLTKADFGKIDKWIAQTSESASATTSSRLENIFKRAASSYDEEKQKGITPREIADEILNAGMVQSEARAKMLAHTGSMWSYNEGATQRYQSEGVAVVEWLTADDDMRCPFCAEMNGKRIETGEPFFRSGDVFSHEDRTLKIPTGARGFDVRHPPLHPNCRCTLVPIFEEDL